MLLKNYWFKSFIQQTPMMGSEDFSYFKRLRLFAWIGNGASASLHNPKYDLMTQF